MGKNQKRPSDCKTLGVRKRYRWA